MKKTRNGAAPLLLALALGTATPALADPGLERYARVLIENQCDTRGLPLKVTRNWVHRQWEDRGDEIYTDHFNMVLSYSYPNSKPPAGVSVEVIATKSSNDYGYQVRMLRPSGNLGCAPIAAPRATP